MEEFIRGLPKVELHLHIEGTLEPEMMFEMAERNGVELPFADIGEVRAAYEFSDLQSFLDIYYQGAGVLQTEQDFYDLMWAYLTRMADENLRTSPGWPMRTCAMQRSSSTHRPTPSGALRSRPS